MKGLTQFKSGQFQWFCNFNGIQHILSAPYHPMSNGQAERFVDTFRRTIQKLEGEGNVDEKLEIFLKTYRSTPTYGFAVQQKAWSKETRIRY